MKEVVIVPTYDRSEFLYVCLEAIRVAEPTIPIHVFPDRGTDESEVTSKFEGVTEHKTLQHSYHGNSFNMLEALKWAYQQNERWDRIWIIEDDAIIDSTAFSWGREALLRYPDSFAACLWMYSPDALISDGPDLRIPWYLSVGTVLPRSSVFSIVQHARIEYYSAMKSYLDQAYPGSNRRGSQHYEQDGLILRVMESESKRAVWPRRPRATHCGWAGYHMGKERAQGSLQERVAVVKLALKNPSLLTRLMAGGRVPQFRHCEGCDKPLAAEDKESGIVCVDCFHRDRPGLEITSSSHYYVNQGKTIDNLML
jgi:hypothetical protein